MPDPVPSGSVCSDLNHRWKDRGSMCRGSALPLSRDAMARASLQSCSSPPRAQTSLSAYLISEQTDLHSIKTEYGHLGTGQSQERCCPTRFRRPPERTRRPAATAGCSSWVSSLRAPEKALSRTSYGCSEHVCFPKLCLLKNVWNDN